MSSVGGASTLGVAGLGEAEAEDGGRQCWVCFAEEGETEAGPGSVWLTPCKCKGSGRWVHEGCLQRWVDEKQKGDAEAMVACAQCKTPYIILYPRRGPVFAALAWLDRSASKQAPLAAGTVLTASLYSTATAFGAISVLQVMGLEEGLAWMERCDKLVLLLTLPTIPTLLMIGNMVCWEAAVLGALKSLHPPIVGEPAVVVLQVGFAGLMGLLRGLAAGLEAGAAGIEAGLAEDVMDAATRVLCGALALPTVSVLVGNALFASLTPSPLKRAALGGLSYVLLRGLAKAYYRHSESLRRSQRKIYNFTQAPASPSTSSISSASDEPSDLDPKNDDDPDQWTDEDDL